MDFYERVWAINPFVPAALMLLASLWAQFLPVTGAWRGFAVASGVALAGAILTATVTAIGAASPAGDSPLPPGLPIGHCLAVVVQLLGTVIGSFSSRYLQGEPGQRRYIAALASVLAAVHLLLMADHWIVLIGAWALVGLALQQLLCFYPDRPFAVLAAHKKRIADRMADLLLIVAAALAWNEVGSGSLPALWLHVDRGGVGMALQVSAVCLVLAVVLRTALLPVHGWMIQVMEAPTPVSALLHAGVVNLGGYVLIRFAPLLEHAMPARALLVAFGTVTAVLAGLVMLTRISIKVRLAWSTAAQMGFMVLECGLGFYSLAALHLVGHSLYKAQAFLAASTVVRHTRLQALHGTVANTPSSLWLAPAVTVPAVLLVQQAVDAAAWPWWWSAVLGLAWAPLLWLPAAQRRGRALAWRVLRGLLMVAGLTAAVLAAHAIPLGVRNASHPAVLGMVALLGMAVLYVCLAVLQVRPEALRAWWRWSYAGFYVDEVYTRWALQLWPTRWTPSVAQTSPSGHAWVAAADASQPPSPPPGDRA